MRHSSLAITTFLLSTVALVVPTSAQTTPEPVPEGQEQFAMRVVATGLEFPWEVILGPDDQLWITERAGKRVTRVNPEDGTATPLVTIDEVHVGPQHEGLLGMALHPELLQEGSENNFVYLVYTYDVNPAEGEEEVDRRAKIVRYTYSPENETLGDPVDLLTDLPASNDHNAGRLAFGPDQKLYYSIGDQGANQFGNFCNPNRAQVVPTTAEVEAQDRSAYVGKILRLNLDGSIPEDNPEIEGVRSHIYSYGHRNPQGIVFGPDGTLYQAEQGPKTDDEINIIQAGMNYGWPFVAGYQDDSAYVYGAWAEAAAPACADLTFNDLEIPEGVPQYRESEWSHPDFVEPIQTFFTVETGYNFADTECGDMLFICWPTIAPPSIAYYGRDDGIAEWSNSLLLPSLKHGTMYRVTLAEDGRSVEGEPVAYFNTENRYRDVEIGPDGRTLYVATDTAGITAALEGGVTDQLANPGAILAFTYEGEGADADVEQTSAPEASDQ